MVILIIACLILYGILLYAGREGLTGTKQAKFEADLRMQLEQWWTERPYTVPKIVCTPECYYEYIHCSDCVYMASPSIYGVRVEISEHAADNTEYGYYITAA